jgi:cytochrome P450
VSGRDVSLPAAGTRRIHAPVSLSIPLIGDAPGLLADPLAAFMSGWHERGDVVRFRVAPRRAYLLAHPDHIRQVLHERRAVYQRDGWHTAQLQEVSGRGLTASEGALWRQQRSLLRPAFQGERAVQVAAAERVTARMLERWAVVAREGRTVDLHQEMLRVSLEVIWEALFSVSLEHESSRIVGAASVVLDHLFRRMRLPFAMVARLPSWRDAGFRAARDVLYDLARRLLLNPAARRSEGDLLGVLAAYDDRRLAQDQIVTMLLAGHDTTGTVLAWSCYLIATHPEVDRRLHAEAVSTKDRAERRTGLPYASSVFREALRLYPPAWALSRMPIASDVIGGCAVPTGATVFVSPFVTHRHPAFWHDAEQFAPERFASGGGAGHPYAYLPFGAGPRTCIGKTLAEATGQAVISTIARDYRLVPAWSRPISLRPRLTLHPRGQMLARPQPRGSL